jgi:XTP/dITP diphosphohydrolase
VWLRTLNASISRLVLASGNQGKLREFSRLLAPLAIEVRSQSEWSVPACPEPHFTFVENALAKARHAAKLTQLPALADDSGICVQALHGAPGVVSARMAQTLPWGGSNQFNHLSSDEANNQALLNALRQYPLPPSAKGHAAYYVCVLVLVMHELDPQPLISQASWHGQVIAQPAGEGGFGYDPHFWLPSFNCTVAQLSLDKKNLVSHRARATELMIRCIREFGHNA